MTAEELRQKYLNFFKERGHTIIPSASLIPEHDPTVLFTTAGMHPLTSFLLGEKHPGGKRLADVQKCIRTGDIDDVRDSWHLTFFEMLGNWSLGDYWKKEAIEWSFEFLTDKKYLGLPSEKLSVTVFAGDKDAPVDEDSVKIWQSLDIPNERIFYLPKDENWWGPAGQTGPCGPCSEMFYDTGKEKCGSDCKPGCKCGKYAEVWNDVFMEFNKTAEGKFEQLKQKNVDTGMGVERTIAVLGGFDNVYDTELFKPLIKKIEEISNKKYEEENIKPFRIIADHLKAAAFIMAEGVEPSNVERGYVLRRLIRRAVRYGKLIGINDVFTFKVANVVIEMYKNVYPELGQNCDFIEEQLVREEEKFGKTLEKGLKELEKMKPKREEIPIPSLSSKSFMAGYGLSGNVLFDLYSTYGFPIEMSLEEIKKLYQEFNREQGVNITELPKDVEEILTQQFHKALQKHQDLSRAGAEQKFKGGLADHSEQVVKYHTAAHLMLAALRKVLGSQVTQKGSNITAERLRFDFSYPQKLTSEQIEQVEDLVNQAIMQDLPVKMEEMSLDQAKEEGAMGVFESRYGEKVKVYTIAENGKIFSKEICGGPHIEKTGVLGKFKILKEEAVSAGVRRVKAILE